jgi:general secretion pathway protein G
MLKRRIRLAVGVITVMILAGLLISRYDAMMLNSREEMLKQNLASMRGAIKQYINDKQRAPRSLQDLVESGYFRQLPIDPITNSNSSWKPVVENVAISPGQTERGITDLHSGSTSASSNGTVYSAW